MDYLAVSHMDQYPGKIVQRWPHFISSRFHFSDNPANLEQQETNGLMLKKFSHSDLGEEFSEANFLEKLQAYKPVKYLSHGPAHTNKTVLTKEN